MPLALVASSGCGERTSGLVLMYLAVVLVSSYERVMEKVPTRDFASSGVA